MHRSSKILPLLVTFLAVPVIAQVPAPAKPALLTTDHSQEAFVIEQFSRKEKFENDGTFSREDSARVRIQSEAGVQNYGLLAFSYASATGTFEISYVRVRKPDGSTVETPPDNVQDMAAQITREAPFYSDLHEKHVAVKGLSVGDVLEFKTQEHTTKPLAPGQFWTSYRFSREQIVLDEELEISVPKARLVKMKSTDLQPTASDSDAYRVYTWHHKNLEHKDETNEKQAATERLWQQLRGRLPQADVLMSSFGSWEDVGRWYGGLQDERVKPSPEVTAKALELTRSAPSDDAKLRALYGYVSTQFRYIGIAFGIGRYQPHTAGKVLANQYGDCKDKHTLLASLLISVGIPAYPALIPTSAEVDGDVPSPGQFDHVITVVPRGGGLVWLDATAEVGPYQYLLSPLRDKHALVIWKDKPAALLITPVDPPYPQLQTFNMEGKLSDTGTMEGKVDFSARGDTEYLLRSGFRSVALPQWKELGQRISMSLGFGGEVSEVTPSSPEKTDEPFHLAYKYTRKEFGDWANGRTVMALPLITLLASGDEETLPSGPTWLGSLLEVQCHGRMELPRGYRPQIPTAIHFKRDFAQYDSTYEFKDGALIGDRHLKTLLHEVPASEREDYKQFVKIVFDDYGAFIPLSGPASSMAAGSGNSAPAWSLDSTKALSNLPMSLNPEASRLADQARDEITKNDSQDAISSLYRAVSADPKFTKAWVMLGGLLLMQKQVDAGVDAFRKAMDADPSEPAIPVTLVAGLISISKYEETIPVLQEFVKAHPDNADMSWQLGICLQQLKRYSDAAAAFEASLKIDAARPDAQGRLGTFYLLAGDREKASAAFAKLADNGHEVNTLNSVAYEMANADLELPLALEFAKKAVRATEEESQKMTLADLKVADLRKMQTLAAYWDTLGWVNDRMSNMPDAEQYLMASWKLGQDGEVASHLCEVYERIHKIETAIQMCSLALDRMSMSQNLALSQFKPATDEAKKRLDRLMKDAPPSTNKKMGPDRAISERTFKLPRFLPGTESAEFFVLLGSNGKDGTFRVEDVKFVSGSEKMKLQAKQLRNIDFKFSAPSDIPTRVVRRGILGCYQYTGCSFVLLDLASMHSVD